MLVRVDWVRRANVVLQLPQLITNYKAQSADGLSMAFLFVWLFGDVANLSGELYLGSVFVSDDDGSRLTTASPQALYSRTSPRQPLHSQATSA